MRAIANLESSSEGAAKSHDKCVAWRSNCEHKVSNIEESSENSIFYHAALTLYIVIFVATALELRPEAQQGI